MELEKTLTLKKPVKIGDQDFLVLNLREPTATELSKAASAKNNVEAIIELVSMTAKVPRLVAESLCARDFKECDAFFGGFAS
jgi:hypothetical protein